MHFKSRLICSKCKPLPVLLVAFMLTLSIIFSYINTFFHISSIPVYCSPILVSSLNISVCIWTVFSRYQIYTDKWHQLWHVYPVVPDHEDLRAQLKVINCSNFRRRFIWVRSIIMRHLLQSLEWWLWKWQSDIICWKVQNYWQGRNFLANIILVIWGKLFLHHWRIIFTARKARRLDIFNFEVLQQVFYCLECWWRWVPSFGTRDE